MQNNGENNAISIIERALTHDPVYTKLLAPTDPINVQGLSDSHTMSIYMDMLRLMDFSAEEIVASTIHPFNPTENTTSQFYNLFAKPFEGPNASVIYIGHKLIFVCDLNGFRPLVGAAVI